MTQAAIFDDLTALSDATRSRMLLILERHELTVSELCAVLQLPQSTVSRHLKTLADASWVASRRDGTSRYYTLALDERDAHTRRLWSLLREQIATTAGADQDARRLKGVLGRRQSKSEEFFASAAGQWDRLRRELFGAASALHALPALIDARWTIGDLGCGTGETSAALAPFVARTVAVDRSGDMLQAARRRLRDLPNVEVRRGELEALPMADGELDAAVMMLVLHHVPDSCCATCCRTTMRSINSRWGTCGWASATTSCGGSWAAPDSKTSASSRSPRNPTPKARRSLWRLRFAGNSSQCTVGSSELAIRDS